MAFRKINVNAPFFSNMEDESRSGVVSEERRDVIKDTLGSTIRRPGLLKFGAGVIPSIDGQFYWENRDLVYLVAGGDLYSLNKLGQVSLIGSDLFEIGEYVTWAESADFTLVTPGATRKLFAVNGGQIVEYDGATAQKLQDADAPSKVSHIIMFDSYLLANNLANARFDESIFFSKVADPISWEGAFFSAENKSDKITAMHIGWDEIALFGSKSIENYYNDGITPFVPIPGGNVESGTLSPWTIKLAGNSYIYLDTGRKLIRLAGRQPVEVSQAIDNLLDGDVDYLNAEGEVFTLRSHKIYLLTINDRTFAFDYEKNEWVGEWGSWNKATAKYDKFPARNIINVKQWGMTLCTDKKSGAIYKLDFDTYQDDGQEIRSAVVTGNIDHGTGREKRSNELRVRLKRGQVQRTSMEQIQPKMLVRWRDNGSKKWNNYRELMLGFQGDTEFYYSIYQLGSYRARQYEFIVTDDTPFSLIEVEEDVDLLR